MIKGLLRWIFLAMVPLALGIVDMIVAFREGTAVYDWIQRHRGRVLHELERACSGPVRLTVDDRLALDGWAMKGLPPAGKSRKGCETAYNKQ